MNGGARGFKADTRADLYKAVARMTGIPFGNFRGYAKNTDARDGNEHRGADLKISPAPEKLVHLISNG